MKKLIAIIAALSILLTLCSCDKGGDETALYDKGLEIVSEIDKALDSDECRNAFADNDLFAARLEVIAAEERTTPKAVYSVELTPPQFILDAQEGLSDEEKKKELGDIIQSGVIYANSYSHSFATEVAELTHRSATFKNTELKDNIIYVYTFENATSVAVIFLPEDDGTVKALGYLLFPVDASETEEDIKNCFKSYSPKIEKVR